MPQNITKIFSFFSGSGLLDLGFEYSGYDVAFVNEYFTPFIEAYMYARDQMKIKKPEIGYFNCDINDFSEIRKVELKEYVFELQKKDKLVGFIGGPPCPDFSVGGKNRGRDGDNGKLSLTYAKLIMQMQPDFFLFENVKGLWRTARHREFYEEIKSMLHSAGYCTTERLTNALEFGVPQDRDRILLFGIKSSRIKKNYHLADKLLCFPWDKNIAYSVLEIKALPWPSIETYSEDSSTICPEDVKKELTVEYWFEKNDVLDHPNASHYFTPRLGLFKMQTIGEGDVTKKSYKRLHRWRYSPTAAYGNNEVHLHPYQSRRLSAAEAMAIQSLPKSFALPNDMSLSNMFKTIGNGVPFLLAKGVAESISEYLEVAICSK